MALATLAQLKTQLGIKQSEVQYDAKLNLYLLAASAWCENYCDRSLEAQNITELFNGNRTNYLNPHQYPILSVSELRISGSRDWLASDTLIPPNQYGITNDAIGISYYAGFFPKGYDVIRLVYRAGYEQIPDDLQLACLWTAEWFYLHNSRGDSGRTSVSKQGESVGVLADFPPMVKSILSDYKRLSIPASAIAPDML